MKSTFQSLGVDYKMLGLDLSDDKQSSRWEQTWHEVCGGSAAWSGLAAKHFTESSTASTAIAAVWSKCMERDGFHVSSSVAADGKGFTLEFRYGTAGDSSFDFVYTTPSSDVTCAPGLGTELAANGSYSVVCNRANPRADVLFAINSRKLGSRQYQVPGVKPLPSKPDPVVTVTTVTGRDKAETGEPINIRIVPRVGPPVVARLNNPDINDFEPNARDVFRVKCDLSSGLQGATVWIEDKDGKGFDDWQFNSITLEYGGRVVATCRGPKWMGDGKEAVQTVSVPCQ